MEAMKAAAVGEERVVSEAGVGGVEDARQGEEGGEEALSPTLSHQPFSGAAREREQEEVNAPGLAAESADLSEAEHEHLEVEDEGWRGRAEVEEERVAELGDRLGAVEAAAEDLRRIVGESERARQVDRELLIAGVVDLDGARGVVEEQIAAGATVLEAVSRVRERRPLLFVVRARGIRATGVPAVEGGRGLGARSVEDVAKAARETGDRRLLLRYLRMRRGEG